MTHYEFLTMFVCISQYPAVYGKFYNKWESSHRIIYRAILNLSAIFSVSISISRPILSLVIFA